MKESKKITFGELNELIWDKAISVWDASQSPKIAPGQTIAPKVMQIPNSRKKVPSKQK